MSFDTPIQSALEAERNARHTVEKTREQAALIRQEARQQARHIEERAQERMQRLHNVVELELASHRKLIEGRGAEALRKLRREAIDPNVMEKTIEVLIRQIMAEGNVV